MVLPTLCYVVSQHPDETEQMVCKTVVELGKHGMVICLNQTDSFLPLMS